MSYPSESPFQQPGSGGSQRVEPPSDEVELQTATFTDSGNLKSATYDPAASVLTVTFEDGSKYKYAGIENTLAEDFYTANEGRLGSFGKFFAKYIRPRGGKRVSGDASDKDDAES